MIQSTTPQSNPQFPIYIVSKGRYDTRLSMIALDTIGVPYRVVVEEQEFDSYASVIHPSKLLVLDPIYKKTYDTYDELGMSKSVGPGAARNFAWEHSISEGAKWHWVMDDNIRCFYFLERDNRTRFSTGVLFAHMEAFALQFQNLAMCGPQYSMFAVPTKKMPPLIMNTRIYSCNLIRNDVPFRWRGRYNEDTDLSLRMLKAKWCTVLFNQYLQFKVVAQAIRGGNTAEFYEKEGTLPKSQMLVKMHPDVCTLKYRFKRWHHLVNCQPFKLNRLVRDIRQPQLDTNCPLTVQVTNKPYPSAGKAACKSKDPMQNVSRETITPES